MNWRATAGGDRACLSLPLSTVHRRSPPSTCGVESPQMMRFVVMSMDAM